MSSRLVLTHSESLHSSFAVMVDAEGESPRPFPNRDLILFPLPLLILLPLKSSLQSSMDVLSGSRYGARHENLLLSLAALNLSQIVSTSACFHP